MPPQSRTIPDVNHTVLSRYLPRLQKILSLASYAVLYTYNHESGIWQKADTEGSLFICSLSPTQQQQQEEYTIILLNRRGLQNFIYALTDPGNIEYAEGGDYVMLQGEEEKIVYGIWVYAAPGTSSEGDRTKVAEWVKECAGRYVEGMAKTGKGQKQQQQQVVGGDVDLAGGRSISLTELFQSSSLATATIPQLHQHHHQHPTPTHIPAQDQQEAYFHHQPPPPPPPPLPPQLQEATGGDSLMGLFGNTSGMYAGRTASGH
ncbi:PH domain-like protein [Tuber magnatum]|uniref:PH domain-like protein n=1 Tax=Tuber magnatum TaxID=42249 RepID=A0A317SW73_9PEZI|nr:PH domain-like protein [Tuber magnatum]